MMTKKTMAGHALLLWGALSAQGMSEDNLHFTGQLISSACTLVITGNNLADVTFPVLNIKDLQKRGQSVRVPFILQLKDCNTALGTGVTVTFSGTEVSDMAGILALDGQSQAEGVGIGIETAEGNPVAINGSSGATFVLNNGQNSLNFNAWVQTIPGAEMTPGRFSATATAAFEYL